MHIGYLHRIIESTAFLHRIIYTNTHTINQSVKKIIDTHTQTLFTNLLSYYTDYLAHTKSVYTHIHTHNKSMRKENQTHTQHKQTNKQTDTQTFNNKEKTEPSWNFVFRNHTSLWNFTEIGVKPFIISKYMFFFCWPIEIFIF